MENREGAAREVIIKAIKTFGEVSQKIVAIEELSELTKEITKNLRGEENIDHLAEEIADVEIMIAQLKAMFESKDDFNFAIEIYKDKKIKRLEKRINEKR